MQHFLIFEPDAPSQWQLRTQHVIYDASIQQFALHSIEGERQTFSCIAITVSFEVGWLAVFEQITMIPEARYNFGLARLKNDVLQSDYVVGL